MRNAFVFGKFYPLHCGHTAMIDFALNKSDTLTVIVCASSKEKIDGALRASWIKSEYSSNTKINVINFEYDEALLPNTSESDRDVSKAWAKAFSTLVPDANLVITSEPYGDYLAEHMKIQHIPFDQERLQQNICASDIRRNLITHWEYLPTSVKQRFQTTVNILGTESTGKTTLVSQLIKHFPSTAVYEAGRDIIPDSSSFDFEQLYTVTSVHAQAIAQAQNTLEPFVFVDTDCYTTLSYGTFMFGKNLQLEDDIYRKNTCDIRLYLGADAPFVQDGTRMSEEQRNKLDSSHRKTLANHNQQFIEVNGSWEERFEKAKALIANHNHFD